MPFYLNTVYIVYIMLFHSSAKLTHYSRLPVSRLRSFPYSEKNSGHTRNLVADNFDSD